MRHEFIELLTAVCAERHVAITPLVNSWVLLLSRQAARRFVVGYDFDLNSAASLQIAKNKAATSQVLSACSVPSVEHRLVDAYPFVGPRGNWEPLLDFFNRHPSGVVIKPCDGSGGREVRRIHSIPDLEQVVPALLMSGHSVCVAPYVSDAAEYRVIVLDHNAEVIYRKRRPALVGDGRSRVRELIAQELLRGATTYDLLRHVGLPVDGERILDEGESIDLEWRHNLALGSQAEIVPQNTSLWLRLGDLATRAASIVGLRVAAVDIFDVDGNLLVLEINSGIMLVQFAQQSAACHEIAWRVYGKIVDAVMSSEPTLGRIDATRVGDNF